MRPTPVQPDEHAPRGTVPVLPYATPGPRRGIPAWVKELWAIVKGLVLVLVTWAFVLALGHDRGPHVEGGSTRPFMALYLTLVTIGVAVRCLRARSVAPGWRLSVALAVPFVLWQLAAVYVELAYMRDGWPWINVYAEAREEIALAAVGLVWLVVSIVGFARSRRNRAACPFSRRHPEAQRGISGASMHSQPRDPSVAEAPSG